MLFSIDPHLSGRPGARQGALAQEQARYRQTERDLRRIRELQKGFASEASWTYILNFEQEQGQYRGRQGRGAVQADRSRLHHVEAPISGITSEAVSEGSLIVANDPNSSLLTRSPSSTRSTSTMPMLTARPCRTAWCACPKTTS